MNKSNMHLLHQKGLGFFAEDVSFESLNEHVGKPINDAATSFAGNY